MMAEKWQSAEHGAFPLMPLPENDITEFSPRTTILMEKKGHFFSIQ